MGKVRIVRMGNKRCQITACPLHPKIEVPYTGNKRAKVVWVGESPGRQEERLKIPFIGDAGDMSKDCCEMAGLDWDSMFIMNSARCRIRKDELGTKEITEILKCCRRHVVRAINYLKPKLIIATGDFALRQILKRSGITKARGKFEWSTEFNCWVLPTFHAAYILRNRALQNVLVEDLKVAVEMIDNDFELPRAESGLDYGEADNLGHILRVGSAISVDTETQGLDWMDPNFVPIGASLSARTGEACFIYFFEECDLKDKRLYKKIIVNRPPEGKKKPVPTEVGVRKSDNFDKKMDQFRQLLLSRSLKKYMMTGYDRHVFDRLFQDNDWPLPEINNYVMDIQAGAHVMEENIFKMTSLEMIQRMLTDYRSDYTNEFEMKYNKNDMLAVPREDMIAYACADADVTRRGALRIRKYFMKPENKRQALYFIRFVMPTLGSLHVLERNGAYIDREQLPIVMEEVSTRVDQTQKEALKVVHKQIKLRHEQKGLRLTRDDFVRDILFDDDGFSLKVIKKTKNKAPSIDKEVRKTLQDLRLTKKARTFIEKYDVWSEFHTLLTRYLRGFEKWIRRDGRIHANHSLTTAVTGRTSTSKPNMQNNPKRSESAYLVRQLIAAMPGWRLLAADESQSELRWAAHLSCDPEMIRIFSSTSFDIHTETAKGLSGSAWEQLNEHELSVARRNAKAVNFGLLFGMSVGGFIKYAKLEYGIELDWDQAEQWVLIFFAKYNRLPIYHREMIEFCRRNGYVESPLGRRRRLPEIHSQNKMLRAEAERMAINHPIQNPSSDVVLIALNELLRKGELNPDECRPILFVHDELVFEVKDGSKIEDYAKIVKYEMEHPPLKEMFDVKLRVPLVAEVKVGGNLARMEKMPI